MGYWNYAPYVSVAQKRAKAEKKLKQLQKKNPNMRPVVIEGSAIAVTWWGKAWNRNLESYADYANRIGRGRSYVRHRAVLDLQIKEGVVEALVQGSQAKPYSVKIRIKAMSQENWRAMKVASLGKLDSLQELLAGKFPKGLAEVFTTQGKGLFPSPKEIEFDCSCPDWASMCKHVAATLYGIGARLDQDPGLFFTLRQVKMRDLVSEAVEGKTRELLKKAGKKTSRVIADSDLGDVFGIDMETPETPMTRLKGSGKIPVKAAKTKKPAKIVSKKGSSKPAAEKTGKIVAPQKTLPKTKTPSALFETVVKIVQGNQEGITVAAIVEKTGFSETQVRNIIYRARKLGKIKSRERGVYSAAE